MLDKTREGSDGSAPGRRGRPSLRSAREALQPDAPPPPPRPGKRRRHPILATLSGLLSFIGIAAVALGIVLSLGLQRLNAPGPLPADKVVVIQQGNDVSAVDQLADAGVIDNRALMTAALWLEGNRSAVKAGEYQFKQAASLREVIDLLVSGKQVLHSVTIPEGLTSEQVVDRLRDNDVLIGDIVNVPPEGTLMPETYKFARGTTRDQVIRSMEAAQKKVLADVWAHRSPDTIIRSPYELVTLASIVEKETGRADERPRVAGVFVNRLARSMPLQSDPTIVYGLVGGKGTLGRGILKSELEQKTPYNTYQITGLPPGPIANPGKAAMEAVANPSRTKDLYFVADGTGGHAFSDNLDQHRLNVQRWRQIEKDAKDKVAPDTLPGTPGAKSNQRGDAESNPAVYGALNLDIAGSRPATVANITSFPVFSNGATVRFAPSQAGPAAPQAVASGTYNELDVDVAGLKSRDDPAVWDDDGMGGPRSSMAGTYPVPPAQLADQRARAAALGLPTTAPSEQEPAAPVATDANGTHLYGKGRIIDASEGTSFDPLRDKSYDLTSAKVVPVIKALPPVRSVASGN